MTKLHISVGGSANGDLQLIQGLGDTWHSTEWTVPKSATIGDGILLMVPSRTGPLRAMGVVEGEPFYTNDFGGTYRALISIRKLKVPVLLADLLTEFPDWDYLTNAKGYTTVPKHIEQPLKDFIESYQEAHSVVWRRTRDLDNEQVERLAGLATNVDGRERTAASIVLRRGQGEFRRQLLQAYGKCAVTRYTLPDCLEAAHIRPYLGEHTNQISNGLLLRGDIHTLFDLNLLSIDPDEMQVVLSPRIVESEFKFLAGKIIHLPEREEFWPHRAALRGHFGKLRR